MGFGIRAIVIADKIDFETKAKIFELTATSRGARVRFSSEQHWDRHFLHANWRIPGLGRS